jgi:hypothetical protein
MKTAVLILVVLTVALVGAALSLMRFTLFLAH